MINSHEKITVYYDGSCPRCIKDRNTYQKLAGKKGNSVDWFDITDQDTLLLKVGIDPLKALTELHVKTASGNVLSELDAYILLIGRIRWLTPLAFFISLPFIRPLLARYYLYSVTKRLRKSGRYPQHQNCK